MTFDDIEKALWGLGVAAVGGLAALVRGGDVKRLEAIEDRQRDLEKGQKDLENNAAKGRERIYDEIHSLRQKVDANHNQLVTLLIDRKP